MKMWGPAIQNILELCVQYGNYWPPVAKLLKIKYIKSSTPRLHQPAMF